MPDIYANEGFSPKADVLKYWLGTRKDAQRVGTELHPGLFSTKHYPRDLTLAVTAIILDIVTVSLVVLLAQEFSILIGGIFVIIFDIVGAHLAHSRVIRKTALTNLIILRDSANVRHNKAKANDRESLKRGLRFREKIGEFLILISCGAKLYAVLAFAMSSLPLWVVVAIALTYIFIAYVHLYHTGFVLWEVYTNRKFYKENKKKNEVEIEGEINNVPFEPNGMKDTPMYFCSSNDLTDFKSGNTMLSLVWKSVHSHNIKFGKISGDEEAYNKLYNDETEELLKEDSQKGNVVRQHVKDTGTTGKIRLEYKVYQIICSGIPTDEDVKAITNNQFEGNQNIVIKKLMEFQLKFLDLQINREIPKTLK